MRYVSTRVFPLPAPARMRSGPSVCSTASSCVEFSESRSTREGVYQPPPRLTPEPMHQHSYPPPALLHHQRLHRVLESLPLHQLEKGGRVLALRIGEDGLAARRDQAWDEVREGGG